MLNKLTPPFLYDTLKYAHNVTQRTSGRQMLLNQVFILTLLLFGIV